ncbi:DsrE family protein [Chitinophaga sp. 22321]|nr:DsrE family protein [Chitinophaga hostae]
MKKLFVLVACLLGYLACCAQSDYKVVFDITSKAVEDHNTLMRQVNSILKSSPDAQLEVAVYGEALDMVLKDKSKISPALTELLNNKKVAVKVCGITMKRNNKDASELIPGVEIVPDAIYEIITKQKEGWGYIKVAH